MRCNGIPLIECVRDAVSSKTSKIFISEPSPIPHLDPVWPSLEHRAEERVQFVQAVDAKEVGVGNPAEKTYHHPNLATHTANAVNPGQIATSAVTNAGFGCVPRVAGSAPSPHRSRGTTYLHIALPGDTILSHDESERRISTEAPTLNHGNSRQAGRSL